MSDKEMLMITNSFEIVKKLVIEDDKLSEKESKSIVFDLSFVENNLKNKGG